MSRWRITITDTKKDEPVLDIEASRLVASAVAMTCGLEDAARQIIGDPRSDS